VACAATTCHRPCFFTYTSMLAYVHSTMEFKYAKAERISLPAKSIDGPLRFNSGLPFRECCRTNRSPFSKRINRQYRNSHKANKYRD
jgi:hypothetical protein